MRNEIPAHWTAGRWGDLIELVYGRPLREPKLDSGPVPVWGTNGPTGSFVTKAQGDGPTVVVGRKGAYRGVVLAPGPFWVIDTAFFARPLRQIDMSWAYLALAQHNINRLDSGSAIPSTRRQDVYSLPVLIPPVAEQRAIASVLTAFDEKIESNTRLAQRLRDLLPALFDRCVSQADEYVTLGDLGSVVGGGTPKSSEPSYWKPAEVAWVTPKDMSVLEGVPLIDRGARGISHAGLRSSAAKILPAGSVLYTSRATLGLIAITRVPLATNQGFISVVPDSRFGSAFVYCALVALRNRINGRANGSTFMEVNKTNFKAVACPSPSDDRLLTFRGSAEPLIDSTSAAIDESRTLTAIRDALLPKLVSGQIRVPLSDDPEEQLGAASEGLEIAEGAA